MAKNITERIQMVNAMEYIMRQLNDEAIFEDWLTCGVADGDIDYMSFNAAKTEDMDYYTDNGHFADLIDTFCRCMAKARKSGGLYCDGICAGERK